MLYSEAMVNTKVNDIDYEDILDNLDDYKDTHNHIICNINSLFINKYTCFARDK